MKDLCIFRISRTAYSRLKDMTAKIELKLSYRSASTAVVAKVLAEVEGNH